MDEKIEQLFAFYALGSLTAAERSQVEAYVASNPDAKERLEEMIRTASALAYERATPWAEYRTIQAVTYGRFETRMRSAGVSGMLSSFFTYYDAASPWNEIDIETMGRYTNEIQLNTIVPTQADNHVLRFTVPFNPHAAFHVVGFEWTPDYVAWRIDGEEVYRQTGAHIAKLTKAQKIMMNIWQPAYVDWAGAFDPASLPVYAYYDWVKYYAYTPGTGDNFTIQWTDDFNSFNGARWQKATHSWDLCSSSFSRWAWVSLLLCWECFRGALTSCRAPARGWSGSGRYSASSFWRWRSISWNRSFRMRWPIA